jgi:hypothetical protein
MTIHQYQTKMTPTLINPGTESSLDAVLVNGHSVQRSALIEVVNGSNRKVIEVHDGEIFDDSVVTNVQELGLPVSYNFNVINSTGVSLTHVSLAIKNAQAGDDSHVLLWYDLPMTADADPIGFEISGTNYIVVNLNHVNLPVIPAIPGKLYTLNADNSAVVIGGSSGSGTYFAFKNNSTIDATVTIVRNGHAIEKWTISPTSTQTFGYPPNIWITATQGAKPVISDFNTEVSLLGVASADLEITGGSAPFTISLINIVTV